MKFEVGDYVIYNGKSIGIEGIANSHYKPYLSEMYQVISGLKYNMPNYVCIEINGNPWYLYGNYIHEFNKIGQEFEFEDVPAKFF